VRHAAFAAAVLLALDQAASAAALKGDGTTSLLEMKDRVVDPNGILALRVSTRFESGGDEREALALGVARIADRDVAINGRAQFKYTTGKRTHLVLLLEGGDLTVTIDGKSVKHEAGESWVIPPGTTVTFATGNDTASVNWVEIDAGKRLSR